MLPWNVILGGLKVLDTLLGGNRPPTASADVQAARPMTFKQAMDAVKKEARVFPLQPRE
jgi:hypothetical protein